MRQRMLPDRKLAGSLVAGWVWPLPKPTNPSRTPQANAAQPLVGGGAFEAPAVAEGFVAPGEGVLEALGAGDAGPFLDAGGFVGDGVEVAGFVGGGAETGEFEPAVGGVLVDGEHVEGDLGDTLAEVEDGLVEFVRVDGVVDHADLFGFGTVDHVAGEEEFFGFEHADFEGPEAGGGGDAEGAAGGVAEAGVVGGEDDVAGADQFAAAGEAEAVDLGDDRFAVAPHPEPALDGVFEPFAVQGDAGFAEFGGFVAGAFVGGPVEGAPFGSEVVAGAECAAGGFEADDADGVAGAEFAEGVEEVGEEAGAHGVEFFGAVEGDGGDGAVDVEEDVVVIGSDVRHGMVLGLAPVEGAGSSCAGQDASRRGGEVLGVAVAGSVSERRTL